MMVNFLSSTQQGKFDIRLYMLRYVNTSLMEVLNIIIFLRSYSLKDIKNKFIAIYILNVTDIIFTILLLSTGFYMEANILMVKAVESILVSFILKVILPAVIFMLIYFRMQGATDQQLKKSNIFINGAIIMYTLINVSHLVWFLMLPIFMYF